MNILKNIFTHIIVLFLCVISANKVNAQISENFQSWTSRGSYSSFTQAGSGGNWTAVSTIVAPTGAASGTGSTGYCQLQSANGIITLPNIASGGVGTVTIRARVSSTNGGFSVQKNVNGGGWTNVQAFTSSSTVGVTFTATVNDASANIQLRINNTGGSGGRALYVHDVVTTTSVSRPVVSNGSTSGTVGTTFTTYNLSTLSTNSPTSYTIVSGSVPGLAINTTTGAITGTPTTAGTYPIVFNATNAAGQSLSNATLTVTISAVARPVVSNGSTNGTVGTVFTTYNLSTIATNSPTSYTIVSGSVPGLTINTSTGAITGTPTAAGTYSIVFNATNVGGTSLSNATLTITIAKGNQTITFNALSSVVYGTAPGTLTATSSSGLTVSFSSGTTTVATVAGTAITYVGAGSSNITATQAGDANWNAAIAVIRSQVVTAKALTVTGLTGVNKIYDGTTAATATGTATLNGVLAGDVGNVTLSGTPTFTFNTPGVDTSKPITTSGYSLTGSASANYSLTQPTLSANVTAKTITLTGATANNKVYNGTTAATISGGTLNGVIAGDVGNVSVTTGTFASANVGTNIAVTAILSGSAASNYILTQPGLTANITKANQTITFGTLADRFTGSANFTLTATATSGLTVTYTSSNPSVATVAGSTVTIVGAGTSVITASQAGNANYNAAADVTQNQLVISAPQSMGNYIFTSLSLAPTGVIANTTFSNISLSTITQNNAGGSLPNSFSGAPSSGNWGGTINTSRYLQFTITANAGYVLNIYSLDMDVWRSGAGATDITIRSSLDSYASDITTYGSYNSNQASMPTVILPSGFTGISTVTFRIYGWGGSSTGDWRLDNIAIDGSVTSTCTAATALAFQTQPVTSNQDAAIPLVVKAICSGGATATSLNTGSVTLTTTGCGMKQSGSSVSSITANFVNGVATFNNITFSRSTQTNINFTTTNTQGLTNVTSNNFTINAPTGTTPTNTTIASENFESTTSWNYVVGSPSYSGSGGGGVDVTGIKTISGNKSLSKSFSTNNSADERKSTTTVTFDNKTIAASYEQSTFSFQLGSISTGGTGAGVDNADNCTIQISLDGGTSWSTLLTYNGNSDYEFPFSASPVTSLVYNANASYNKPSTKSAFSVQLPAGTTQFRFRMTAANNRINENWALDNVLLVGTDIPSGNPAPLPTATGGTIATCPNTDNTLTVLTSNTVGTVSYSWSPTTNMTPSVGNIATPVVNPTAGTVYTVTITDADYCTATATQTITVPTGTAGLWTGAETNDWFYCRNWGNGVIPTSTTNVTIPNAVTNIATIDPLSTFSTPFSGIAYANNITINTSAQLVGVDNADLQVSANWANNGLFTPGISTVTFTGSGTSTIDGATAQQFNNLTINKTVQLLVDASTNGTGALAVNQLLDLNQHTFTISNPINTAITHTSPGYVLSETQDGAARLLWQIDDFSYTDNYTFPMGNSNGNYLPVTFKLNSGNFGLAGVATYKSTNATAWPTGIENVLDVNNPPTAVQRFWHLESDQPANNYNADVTFSFPGSEDPSFGIGANVKFQRYNKPTDTWDFPLTTQTFTATSTRTVQVSGITKFSWWGGGNDDNTNPLPVELVSFKGNCNAGDVTITWATATETNNDYFTIQRSRNLVDYEDVAIIQGSGNSNTFKTYSVIDENALSGTSYYRLIQTDFNGENEVFNPIVVGCVDNGMATIAVYPNPATNVLNIQVNNGATGKGSITLYNQLGQRVITEGISTSVGINTYTINTNNLPVGQYFVQFVMENTTLPVQKIVIAD
jgi:hypothetical protein